MMLVKEEEERIFQTCNAFHRCIPPELFADVEVLVFRTESFSPGYSCNFLHQIWWCVSSSSELMYFSLHRLHENHFRLATPKLL